MFFKTQFIQVKINFFPEVHTKLNEAMDEIRRLFDTIKTSLKEMEQQSKVIYSNCCYRYFPVA